MAAFGIFWIFITLSVESSVIPIADVIFEHRMYLPMAGVACLFSLVLFKWVEKWGRPTRIDQRGKVLTVFWEDYRREMPSPVARYSADSFGSPHAWVFSSQGWRLSLVFDAETELLQSWKYTDW